jgi:PAS domain S-box-containing protein
MKINRDTSWGIVVNNPDSLVFDKINDTYANMHGYTVEELTGLGISVVFSDVPDNLIKNISSRVKRNGHYQYTSIHRCKDGRLFPAFTDISVLRDNNGNASLIIAHVQDISEQREIDRKIMQAVISTEENERSRFSHILNDDLGPLLSTAKLYVKSFETVKDVKNKQTAVDRSLEAIDRAIMSIKELAYDLSPYILRNFGLDSGITSLIKKINETGSIEIDYKSGLEGRLDLITESTIFRVVTELINNTVKHARADKVHIKIVEKKEELILSYSDNGIGFRTERTGGKEITGGLSYITSRIRSLGGEIVFDSGSGNSKGMKVDVYIPVVKPARI